MQRFILGVDEAGRGPLAGPVAVGVVLAPADFDMLAHFPGLDDSKKLLPEKRDELYALLQERVAAGELQFCVRFSSHTTIDTIGISKAVRRAVWSGVRRLAPREASLAVQENESPRVRVLLDGLLKAPPEYEQETVIGGDSLVPAISLASVAAKVARDRLMARLAKRFPDYGFDAHKGYGTPEHFAAIERLGLCEIHRRTFIHSPIEEA